MSIYSTIGWAAVGLPIVVWLLMLLGLAWQGFSSLRHHSLTWPARVWLFLQSIPLMMLLSGFMVFSIAVCLPYLLWCFVIGKKPGGTLLTDPLKNE